MGKIADIIIYDEDGKVIDTYYMSKLTVSEHIELMDKYEEYSKSECSEMKKNVMVSAYAISLTLRTKAGDLMYPDHDILNSEMPQEIFSILDQSYLEINPFKTSLSTKKKKKS